MNLLKIQEVAKKANIPEEEQHRKYLIFHQD